MKTANNLILKQVGKYLARKKYLKKQQRKHEVYETPWKPNWEPFFQGKEIV